MSKREKPVAFDIDFDEALERLAQTDLAETKASENSIPQSLIEKLTLPKGWGVPLDRIINQENIRLDAEHYDPIITENMRILRDSGYELIPLSELSDIDLPGQFVRIWAQDKEHGIPYLNATDLMSYLALGVPAQARFLSHASDVKMERLIVREGMLLVTCSGTIGRVFEVPCELDGWAGTHDIVRIAPRNPAIKGYIRAMLSSRYVQVQILSHTHGGQIDHITAEQIASCLIPMLPDETISVLSKRMDEAEQMRQKAAKMVANSLLQIDKAIQDA